MTTSKRHLLLAGAAMIALAGLSAPAAAQDAPTPAHNAATPAQDQTVNDPTAVQSGGDIIVTAEKRSTTIQNTPLSISVLGGAQLDQSTGNGLSQILGSVPGVAATVNYQTGGTQLAVRGVSAAGATFNGAGTVAYYLDSTPFGFVRTAIGPDLNPYDLSRVEILRGPQGTLYGAGGLNGVVRVLTNDPDLSKIDFKARFDASSTYHAHGSLNYGGDAELNIPLIGDMLAIRGVIGVHHYAGWIDSTTSQGVNYGKTENYRAKVLFKPTDRFTAQFAFWRTANRYDAPSAADDNYFNKAFLPQPVNNAYNSYSLKLGYDADAFTVTSEASYLKYQGHAKTDLNSLGLKGFQGQTDLSSRVYTEQLDVASKDSQAFTWSAGFFYRDARDITFQPFNTPTAQLIFDNFADGSKSYAIYGELGYKFADDKLQLTGGLRYFHDDSLSQALSPSALGAVPLIPFNATFHAFTPRVVLQYRPDRAHSFYASYSQGFRSGVVQDEEITLVAPNFAAAAPDRLHNFEVGAKGHMGIFDYDAAVFYIKWDKVQQVVSVPVLPNSAIFAAALINGSSASGAGVEGSLYANITNRLRVGGAASYNGLTLDDPVYSSGIMLFSKGQRLNYSPSVTASGSFDYSFSIISDGTTAAFNTSLNYTSHQDTVTLRGTNVVLKQGNNMFFLNSRFSIATPGKHWNFAVFGNNLTNDNGATIRAGSVTYFDSRVQPRTIGVQVEFHY